MYKFVACIKLTIDLSLINKIYEQRNKIHGPINKIAETNQRNSENFCLFSQIFPELAV